MNASQDHRDERTDAVLDFGAEEFYDDDDLEEIDYETDAHGTAHAAAAGDAYQDDHPRPEDPYVAGGQRLQKVLAHAGLGSRRVCEQLIAGGRVSVDGVRVTEPGVRVDPSTQEIRVDGSRVLTDPDVITIMLHKPAGVVTTMEDPQGRPTVAEYAARYLAEHAEQLGGAEKAAALRLVHVGRLDADTEGLLLLSNDGELTHRLTHPSYEVAKTYVAVVKGRVGAGLPRRLRQGVELEDGPIAADRAVVKDSSPNASIMEITLHSGRNRIVRRMLAAVGHPVIRLSRTRLGPLTLGYLRPGAMRALTGAEVSALQREVGL
ncbi:pseudouridine synthase [Actinomyces ruminis]|uniref:Pseudouridine synthase n=1 Tax=Actinomyces ruminis TaxID=1937003 RepID=A0ABX4MDH4_9ACTO|nr:pseudouridine synthase [Actinomyces ruminis]PHP52065.1 rRNA pseudouridine synthase [Actinomyces ruminis]